MCAGTKASLPHHTLPYGHVYSVVHLMLLFPSMGTTTPVNVPPYSLQGGPIQRCHPAESAVRGSVQQVADTLQTWKRSWEVDVFRRQTLQPTTHPT